MGAELVSVVAAGLAGADTICERLEYIHERCYYYQAAPNMPKIALDLSNEVINLLNNKEPRISQKQEVFNVREWLLENGYEKIFDHKSHAHYKGNVCVSFYPNRMVISRDNKDIHIGLIPDSKWFWLELLKNLRVEI